MTKEQAYEKVTTVTYKKYPANPLPGCVKCYHASTIYPVYLKSENFQFAHQACCYCGLVDPPESVF